MGEYAEVNYYFTDAQPKNTSGLSAIPKKYRGAYEYEDAVMRITDKSIYKEYNFKETIHKSELDSIDGVYTYNGSKLTMATGQVYNVSEKNDSLYLTALLRDTLFIISENQKVKNVNNNLVLSSRDSVFWKINILSIKKDSLLWKHPGTKKDFSTLMPIVKDMKTDTDTTVVILNPTDSELRKIVSEPELGWERRFKRTR